MIALTPLYRRIAYVVLFEVGAIALASVLLAALSDGSAKSNLPVAIAASSIALVCNFVYNTAFEQWERRAPTPTRSLRRRLLHAAGFESGLVLILIPLFMWWYAVGPLTALKMEAALLVFFLVFTFVFTWVFDLCVKTAPAPAPRRPIPAR